MRICLALLFCLVTIVLGQQGSKPETQSQKPQNEPAHATAPEPKACIELRRLSTVFVADTIKAANITPEERQKDEQQFLVKFREAAKACRAAKSSGSARDGQIPGKSTDPAPKPGR